MTPANRSGRRRRSTQRLDPDDPGRIRQVDEGLRGYLSLAPRCLQPETPRERPGSRDVGLETRIRSVERSGCRQLSLCGSDAESGRIKRGGTEDGHDGQHNESDEQSRAAGVFLAES